MIYSGFNTSIAETVIQDIQFLRNNYYYFLGRTHVWGNPDTPPTVVGSAYSDSIQIKTDSLFFKKVKPSDVSFVINRYDWTSGTVYTKWNNTVDIRNQPFYVVVYDSVTTKHNVYKCIDNNNGAQSTVKPTGVSSNVLITADGYIWKFMYSITDSMMSAFATTTKIPVYVAMTSHFYNKGSISAISILDGGSGYQSNATITIVGDGTGAIATPVITNGVITGITMNSVGSGYTYATATTSSTTGNTASLRVVINASAYNTEQAVVEQLAVSGAIYAIQIVNGGTFYSSQTTVSVVGDGTGATAVPTITNGVITKITMTAYGSGYTYANLVITDPLENSRPQGAVNFSGYAILSPVGGHGKNAIREFFASDVMFSSSIPLMTFQNSNDFRQFGIVKNPVNVSSGKFSNSSEELVSYRVVFDTVSGLTVDSILTSNSTTDTTSKFRVIYFNTLTKEVILQHLSNKYIAPNTLIGSGGSYLVQSLTNSPVIDKYSGDLMYASNHTPFATVQSQNITLKTLIKF